jgi:hypothetical protein
MESARMPQLPLLLDTSLLTIGATIDAAVIAVTPPPPSTGGLLEKAGSPALRARFTRHSSRHFCQRAVQQGSSNFRRHTTPKPFA